MYHALIFNVRAKDSTERQRQLGGYRIATYLRQEGWDIEVIDYVSHWTLEELQELTRSRVTNSTVFFGFSSIFNHWDSGLEDFCVWVKEKYPDIQLIIGAAVTKEIKSNVLDYYINGYGEYAILELTKSLIGNTPHGGIKFDLKYPEKKVIRANIDYPAYPMKSLMVKYENRDFILPTEWLGIEFSRGCKFECIYCTYAVLGVKGDYTRDADDFYTQMMDTYDRFGVKNYFCSDETFNDRSDKIVKFADAADKLSFQPFISGFIRADLLASRPKDWEHIARLGFLGQFYGIETFNHETGKAIGKGMNPDRLLPGLLEARKYFLNNGRKLYRGQISLICGLPYETRETLNKTRDWLVENWQGESFCWFTLEIGATNDRPSILYNNYQKYGYRKINAYDTDLGFASTDHTIEWENDYWNSQEACYYTYELQNYLSNYDFRGTPFTLGNYYEPIEESIHFKHDFKRNVKNLKRFHADIKSYINKKLSL